MGRRRRSRQRRQSKGRRVEEKECVQKHERILVKGVYIRGIHSSMNLTLRRSWIIRTPGSDSIIF